MLIQPKSVLFNFKGIGLFTETSKFRSDFKSILKKIVLLTHLYSIFFKGDGFLLFNLESLHIKAPINFIPYMEDLTILSILVICSALFALFKKFEHVGMFFSFILGFYLMLHTIEGRFAFSYFPTFLLGALTVSNYTKSAVAILLLISFAYTSAATHKLLNFSYMKVDLYNSAIYLMSGDLFSRNTAGLIAKFCSLIVIPLEYCMGILFLFPKTRKYIFIVCCIFHLSIGFLFSKDGVPFVSFYLLLAHCAFVIHDSTSTKFLMVEKKLSLLYLPLFLVLVLTHLSIEFGPIGKGILRCSLFYLPFCLLAGFHHFQNKIITERIDCTHETKVSFYKDFALNTWGIFMLCWAVFPVYDNYRNLSFGWSMLSGGTFRNARFCIDYQFNQCQLHGPFAPAIVVEKLNDYTCLAYSYRLEVMEEFQFYLKQKNISARVSDIKNCEKSP